jgi:tRNA pseudouridine55 synthase
MTLTPNMLKAGLLLIDKSPGFTSHHIVSYIRKCIKKSSETEMRVGHLGTLDPFASGLLPILIGGATRLSDEMMDGKKQYLFQIKLGLETDTLDTAGQVTKELPVPENYLDKIKDNLSLFTGEIEQVPPVYSALKMQGRPLYEYMRAEGKLPCNIETKKRKISIYKIDLLEDNSLKEINIVTLRVLCGKGTYVRSLARDLAASIGTVGHCFSLRREYVEPWQVENALLFSEDLKPSFNDIERHMVPVEKILPLIPKVTIPENLKKLFSAGNIVTLNKSDISAEVFKTLSNSKNCFAETTCPVIQYYCNTSLNDENSLKIKPYKKMN